MTEQSTQYERFCKEAFDRLFKKLEVIDVAIRGNGKPGLTLRLDRVEQKEQRRGKLLWLITGATIAALVSAVAAWIGRGGA